MTRSPYLGVAALLHHLPLVENDDLVGVLDGGQTVRDDDGSSVASEVLEVTHDLRLRLEMMFVFVYRKGNKGAATQSQG